MTDTWTWATVTQASPLRIKVDGDTSALDATTDDLVGSLAVDDRVRVHLHADGIIVTGIQGGAGDGQLPGRLQSTAQNISGLNLNDYGESGWYRGDNVINAPTVDWYYFQATMHGNLFIVQFATRLYADRTFSRRKQSGVWQPWVEIAAYESGGQLKAADGVADDDVATVGQLYVAVTPTQQVFTSSGTWSKPTGLRAVRVRVIGGGGGGSGSSTNNAGGAGGGGGGYAESLVVASSLSSTVTVTVGPGGTGNIGSGSDGGTSVFSSHATATGGEGGSDVGYGGDGGGGTAGNILASGNAGQSTGDTSVYSTAGIFPGGVGGGSVLGGGGRGTPARAANVDGTPGGANTGGGGGGGFRRNSNVSGGNGGSGVVIVENIF